MNYKGDIIEESLADKATLQTVRIIKTRTETVTPKHKTPWLKQWTLHTIEVPEADARRVADDLSRTLETQHTNWYIDFRNPTTHYVIFPNKVFKVDRSQPEQYKPVVGYGVKWSNKLEVIAEERVEVACNRTIVKQVIAALRQAHPYEEVIVDIVPLIDGDQL
jgi:hypothetical protein